MIVAIALTFLLCCTTAASLILLGIVSNAMQAPQNYFTNVVGQTASPIKIELKAYREQNNNKAYQQQVYLQTKQQHQHRNNHSKGINRKLLFVH
jgi:hypothetical protein